MEDLTEEEKRFIAAPVISVEDEDEDGIDMAQREDTGLLSTATRRGPQGGTYRLGSTSDDTQPTGTLQGYRQRPGSWGLNILESMTAQQRRQAFLVMIGGIAAMLFAVFATIAPLESGLLSNDWTSYIHTDDSYGPGLHFVGLGKSFILFPSNQVSVVFSDAHAKGVSPDAGPISTRTGDDHGEVDSGGQPLSICLSLQYVLPTGPELGKIYSSFGAAYHERFLLITRNVISNVAQEFAPTDFWVRRTAVADAMLAAVQEALSSQGKVRVTQLQLLRIDFPPQYEDMITKIQLQVQSKATSEYEQKVLSILNDLSVLKARNMAQIGVVAAEAERKAATLKNEARARGVVLLQAAKANATRLVAGTLGFSGAEAVQYLKLAAIRQHPSERTTVGLEDPFA